MNSSLMRISMALLAIARSAIAADNAATAQVTTGQLGDATQNLANPMGAAYRGVVKDNSMGIKGSITALSAGDQGTTFAVDISNLPTEGGPFVYHLHVDPVPADGNCTSTLAHLDPFIRGEVEPCTMDRPETCQVGDLSGKHGKINGTSFNASYNDPYVSLTEGMGSFFGNRSFVIHFANKTRIACGNFAVLDAASSPSSASAPSSAPSSSISLDATATLVPAFANNSAATTSALAGSNATAAITSPVLASASAAATSTTLFANVQTSSGGGASGTSSAKPAQESASSASRRTLARSVLIAGSLFVGLWCLS